MYNTTATREICGNVRSLDTVISLKINEQALVFVRLDIKQCQMELVSFHVPIRRIKTIPRYVPLCLIVKNLLVETIAPAPLATW